MFMTRTGFKPGSAQDCCLWRLPIYYANHSATMDRQFEKIPDEISQKSDQNLYIFNSVGYLGIVLCICKNEQNFIQDCSFHSFYFSNAFPFSSLAFPITVLNVAIIFDNNIDSGCSSWWKSSNKCSSTRLKLIILKLNLFNDYQFLLCPPPPNMDLK